MRSVLKFSPPLLLSLLVVACDDGSSSANPDTQNSDALKCVVKSEDPLVMESSFNGVTSTEKLELREGKLFQTVKSANPYVINENCKEFKSDSDYGEVQCEVESVVAISREEMSESIFEKFKKTFKEACESADGTKINDQKDFNSLKISLDSLERTLSSDSKGIGPVYPDWLYSSDSSMPVFSCDVKKSGDAVTMELTSNGVTYKHVATLDNKGKVIVNSTATSPKKMLVAGICSTQQGSGSAKEAVCTETQVSYKTELDIHVSSIDDVVAMYQKSCDEQRRYYTKEGVSSSSVKGPASSSSEMSYILNAELESFIDSRDGEVYTQVQIGDQLWMGQNLRYADSTSLQRSENLYGSMWCLDDNSRNCKAAGALYLWHAVMDKPAAKCGHGKICGIKDFPHRGICPRDWHVPTQAEWQKLQDYVGGTSGYGKSKGYDLMAKSESGSGTDKYSFGAVYTGEYDFRDGYTHQFQSHNNAHFWSATESDSDGDGAYTWYINGSTFSSQKFDKNMGYAVRCIHD